MVNLNNMKVRNKKIFKYLSILINYIFAIKFKNCFDFDLSKTMFAFYLLSCFKKFINLNFDLELNF